MATHRALILSDREKPLSLETVARPTAKAGEVIVRVLATTVVDYLSDILKGVRPYPLILPLIPNGQAIARVEEVGPDAVTLSPGQLVLCDIVIKGRDDPSVQILLGLNGFGYPAAMKLMDGEWRNGVFAEYAKFPLENVYPLNEDILLKEKGYSAADLCWAINCLIPYGGLSDIGIGAGDSVIVAPATGTFGGAAVTVALAMGAKVIAAGRNKTILDIFTTTFGETGRIKTVALKGDTAADTESLIAATGSSRGADAYIDFSPPAAAKSTHIAASLSSLRTGGKAVFMGGIMEGITLPYGLIMFKNLTVQGRFMYERTQVTQLIKMLEAGNLKVGAAAGMRNIGIYGLDKADEALEIASKSSGWGSQVILAP